MIRDRFLEFQRRCAEQDSLAYDGHSYFPQQQLELNIAHLTYDTATRSQIFLQHAYELRDSIDQLHRCIQALQQRQATILSETVVSVEDREQLSALIDEVKQHIRSLRPRVRQIEEDLQRDEADAPLEFRTGAEIRIRRNHCEMLKMRLNDLLLLFNKSQLEYKRRVSKRVKRQLDLAGEHVSSQEVAQMLESRSQEIFYRQINPTTYAARIALEDASNRHDEILQLEGSISELNEIFRDLFDLVHCQNQLVDHIARNVELANEFTRAAQTHVHKAVSYKKSASRNKCIIVLVAIMALMLLFTFTIIMVIAIIPHGVRH